MKKILSKGLIALLIAVLAMPNLMAQTSLKAYSMLPGSISTNGQTTLWASIGGFSTGVTTSGTTTLKPGVLAGGLVTETVLGILENLESSITIYQNFNTHEVVIKNTTIYVIEKARVLTMEGKTVLLNFEKGRYGSGNLSFATDNLTSGVYLIQIWVDRFPVTKKFIVK